LAREHPDSTGLLAGGILLAGVIMLARVVVLAGTLVTVLWPAAAGAAVLLLGAAVR
jgi:hypothetical protein